MNILVRNLFLSLDEDIEKALSILNNQSIQICLVVDEDNKLIGTITDGDIRRGLLKGFTLKTKVIKITNKKFQFIFSHEDLKKAKKLMIDKLTIILGTADFAMTLPSLVNGGNLFGMTKIA